MFYRIPFRFFNKIHGKSPLSSHSLGASSPSELEKIFSNVITPDLLSPSAGTRRRHFTLPVTFWAFLFQTLNPFSSCREALRQIQSKQYKCYFPRIDHKKSMNWFASVILV